MKRSNSYPVIFVGVLSSSFSSEALLVAEMLLGLEMPVGKKPLDHAHGSLSHATGISHLHLQSIPNPKISSPELGTLCATEQAAFSPQTRGLVKF